MPEHPPAVTLSLISHTNVGKTTLARTLLRRDIGEALDQAHVTDTNTAHVLAEDGTAELKLWDTPGFGDTARLLRRLKRSENALGWLLEKTWDRFSDRALWCSQQAVRNVKDEADVVLYLINASEDPGASGYIALEMEILTWIGKPVVVLLNQTGGRGRLAESDDEQRWREHLAPQTIVSAVLTLDAFGRCWVQEGVLMEAIGDAISPEQKKVFKGLRKAWNAENTRIFGEAMDALATELAASVLDSEPAPKETLVQKVGVGRGDYMKQAEKARGKLSSRLADRAKQTLDSLITAHQLEGESGEKISGSSSELFDLPERVNETVWGAIGGVTSGALAGLIVDLKAGGMTFGGGAVAGGILGGFGAYGLARGLNLTKGKENQLRWTRQHFMEQVQFALLSYLAVAHFGRGRGAWEDTEAPREWREVVTQVVEERRGKFESIWKRGGGDKATEPELKADLEKVFNKVTAEVLERLYPDVPKIG